MILSNDFIILENEAKYLQHLEPLHHFKMKKDIGIGNALRVFQNELHSLTNSFVNGGFSKKGYLLYPLVKDVSKENANRMDGLIGIADYLNDNGYDFPYVKKTGTTSTKCFAGSLCAFNQKMSKIKNDNGKTILKKKCGRLNAEDYRGHYFYNAIKSLHQYSNDNLARYLSGFYLHGSLATRDYVEGWSDIDTLAIISKKTLENPDDLIKLRENIYKIRRYFYDIDPLQHHGVIAITENDISNFPQSYFPIDIFNYSLSFFEDKRIEFNARDSYFESIEKLFWFVSYFRKLHNKKNFILNDYNAKFLLHGITLFPSLYLQTKNIFVYKKRSFDILRKYFDNKDQKIFDYVSNLRLKWKKQKNFRIMPVLPHNPLLSGQINAAIGNKNIRKNQLDIKYIANGIYEFSEKAWSNVKNELDKKI